MEANTYVPIAGIIDLLNEFPSATPCLHSLLLARPGHILVFSSPLTPATPQASEGQQDPEQEHCPR